MAKRSAGNRATTKRAATTSPSSAIDEASAALVSKIETAGNGTADGPLAGAPAAEQLAGKSADTATVQTAPSGAAVDLEALVQKPSPTAKATLTPVQKAAIFAGIPVDQVLDFKAVGDRFIVVTISGHKISRTPAEREADARAAANAAAQKLAAKAAK